MKTETGKNNGVWQILLLFVFTRIVLTAIGILSIFYFPSARKIFPVTDLQYHAAQPALLEMWARWDSEWYLLIADHGYDSYPYFKDFGHGKYLPQNTANFFPGYPVLIRFASHLVQNSVLAGVLISNISALFFLYFLYQLGARWFDDESAFRGSLFCVLFPTSFFLSAVYSESLFLAALLGCFYFLEEKKILPAVLACSLAVITRPQAVLAVPAILLLAAQKLEERRVLGCIAITAAIAIPFCSHLWFLEETFGSFRWIFGGQDYFRGEFRYPLYALVRFAQSDIAIHGQHNSMIDFGFACFSLLVLALSFRRIPGAYYLYSIIIVLFPLSSTLFSFSRLCLVNFPLFLFLGHRLTGRTAFLFQIASAMLLAFFMAAFANWYWVG